jgi:hypothetical protein
MAERPGRANTSQSGQGPAVGDPRSPSGHAADDRDASDALAAR